MAAVRLCSWCALLVAVVSGGIGCGGEAAPPPEAPAAPSLPVRAWPEITISKGTSPSAALGQIVPAGGVDGGRWVVAPDGTHLAHTGSPGEPNVVRVWNLLQGAWERQVVLPFAPPGAMGFSTDGTRLAVADPAGGLTVIEPQGKSQSLPPGPCPTISQVDGIPEGGWVVAGPGGCIARHKEDAWLKGPDTGVGEPLRLAHLTRGEPIVAGVGTNSRPAASVWWPEGVPKRQEGTPAPPPPPVNGVSGEIIGLALPATGRAPTWANVSPTLVGTVWVALTGVELGGYDPTTGAALGQPMPSSGPWRPLAGAAVSPDGSAFYAVNEEGRLVSGSTALWEADWETTVPGLSGPPTVLAGLTPLLFIQASTPRILDIARWEALPSPPVLESRPWQPLSLAFGNNGQVLAVSYGSPSVGGTSRSVALWTFDGRPPRQVGLGTYKHPGTFPQFVELGKPDSPVAVNETGGLFAVQGPTGVQLFETSTGVRAGRIEVDGSRGLAFTDTDAAVLVAEMDGRLLRYPVPSDTPGEEVTRYKQPVRHVARAAGRDRVVVGWGGEEGAGFEVRTADGVKALGGAPLPGVPTRVALSATGDRALAAVPGLGLFQWPGGGALLKAQGPEDSFSAVAFHPRSGQVSFSGRGYALTRIGRNGRPADLGTVGGRILDLTYHPLGRCVALASTSGRVEIWGETGPVLSIEVWEGGAWAMWTPDGSAVGSQELVEKLRLREEQGDLTVPRVASTELLTQALGAACQSGAR